jgi:hypothetical protein
VTCVRNVCHIRLPELVLLQGGNKNTTQIAPFLRRNNFAPMNEVIFCRSKVKLRFMGTYLSPDTKEKFEAIFVRTSEYFLEILRAAF